MTILPSNDPLDFLATRDHRSIAQDRSSVDGNARIRFIVAQALVQNRIGFHYQPVVNARRPDVPAFFEMLARLTLPDGKILPASAFIPVIEGGELGRAIDRLALTSAISMLRGNPCLRVSVNMSPLSMGDAEWLEIFDRTTLAADGRAICGRLILEITETSAISQTAQTLDFMNHLRTSGCAFAIDDFGAGATGFRHFRDFRFDLVKIDGDFCMNVHKSPDAQVLIECLMAAARHFEMFTVAERIETEADAAWLRSKGVDCFQGYLYGRPQAHPVMPDAPAQDLAAAG